MGQVVFEAGTKGAGENLAVFAAGGYGTGCVQQLLAGCGFEVAPTFVRAPHEGYVGRVLVVGEPDHAVHAVG